MGCLPLPDGSVRSTISLSHIKQLWLTRRNESRIHDGVERLLTSILDRCEGRRPVAVFHADCAARGKLYFNRIMKEEIISQIQFPLCRGENIPWFGMYGGAEYTRLGGKNMMHTYTTSLYVLVRKKEKAITEKIREEDNQAKSSKLFEETNINNIRLKNRFISSATWQGRANFDGSTSPGLISALLPIARGNVGMITGEMAYVSQEGVSVPGQLGVCSDNLIPGLRRMTDFIHREGVPVMLQLVHSGLFSSPMLTGNIPSGPSSMNTPDGPLGREMSADEIAIIVTSFSDAAARAREAGFDGVQVHAAHGWLLNQFLSSFFNKRTDVYGGNIENRARFLIQVIRKIRNAVGNDFAVTVKINSDDYLPGGFNTDEMIAVSLMLEKEGVDAVEISGGNVLAFLTGNFDFSFSPVSRKDVYYQTAALKFRQSCTLPLILTGGIRTFDEADKLVTDGITDYISMCRPLIREPDLIRQWESGNLKRADCISDNGCFRPGLEGKGVCCIQVKN